MEVFLDFVWGLIGFIVGGATVAIYINVNFSLEKNVTKVEQEQNDSPDGIQAGRDVIINGPKTKSK